MRKRIYAGALAAIMAVSSITATGGTVYAADDKPTICSPDNIEEIINEISKHNVTEKVLLLEPGDYGAIIIDKPHVTVKSQDPKNPAVFKGTDIPQRDSLSDDEAEKLRSSMIQISASDVKVEEAAPAASSNTVPAIPFQAPEKALKGFSPAPPQIILTSAYSHVLGSLHPSAERISFQHPELILVCNFC